MPFAQVGGRRLHYLEAGSGEPAVVLLHGFPLRAEMWAPQLAFLSARHRVIAPDLAGFGRSDPPEKPSGQRMGHYVADVAGLLDVLGLTDVVLGGLSMGGYVAFSFLRRHGPRVRALVLADTRAAADTAEVAARRSAQQAQISAEGTAALRQAMVSALLGDHSRTERPALVEHVHGLTDNSPAGFVAALEAMKNRPDHTPDLAALDLPTLVLVGEQDALSPPEVVRAWQQDIAGSTLVTLPLAGHLSNLEAPDELNAAVAAFLSGLR